MSLISEDINNELNDLIGKANNINRLLDRQMSLLSSKFLMKRTAHLLHPIHAHYFSLVFADAVAEYQDKRGNLSVYPGTPDNYGNVDYNNPTELFKSSLEEILDLESKMNEVIDLCNEEKDMMTSSFLYDLAKGLIDDSDMAQTIYELAEAYGERYLALDSRIHLYLPIAQKDKDDEA